VALEALTSRAGPGLGEVDPLPIIVDDYLLEAPLIEGGGVSVVGGGLGGVPSVGEGGLRGIGEAVVFDRIPNLGHESD